MSAQLPKAFCVKQAHFISLVHNTRIVTAQDPHRISDQLDDATTKRLIDRLESRAKDTVFNQLFTQYIDRLNLSDSAQILEVGCGTGAMMRALARKQKLIHSIVGVDQCTGFIHAARKFAAADGLGDTLIFATGDAHALDFSDASFDVVILHTVVSHTSEPLQVLSESIRVLGKGGRLVIFDGDYTSLTFAAENHELGREMDHALTTASFNNPLIMRDLIRILPDMNMVITDTLSNVVSEIGTASYFKTFAHTYAPLVARSQLLSQTVVDTWLQQQALAMNNGTFFASCNYYTYIAQKF